MKGLKVSSELGACVQRCKLLSSEKPTNPVQTPAWHCNMARASTDFEKLNNCTRKVWAFSTARAVATLHRTHRLDFATSASEMIQTNSPWTLAA